MNIVNVSTHNLKIRTHTEDGSYTFTLMAGEKIDLPPKDCKIMINNFHVDSPYDADDKLKNERNTALEEVVREFLESEMEWRTDFCPSCDSHAISGTHKPNCLFIKARAVLEGK